MTDLIDTTEMYPPHHPRTRGGEHRAAARAHLRTSRPLRSDRVADRRPHGARRSRHRLRGPHSRAHRRGRNKAVNVMRKHRLAERLLSDVIGLDWAFVHEEACRWEHVMSEQVERRLVELLGHPTESPYGNPIPGLDQLGDVPARTFERGRHRTRAASERRGCTRRGHGPSSRRAGSGRSRAARAVA